MSQSQTARPSSIWKILFLILLPISFILAMLLAVALFESFRGRTPGGSGPTSPAWLVGSWKMDVPGYHPFTVTIDPEYIAHGDNDMIGLWYVQDGKLVFHWPNKAIDAFDVDNSGTMNGTSAAGTKLTLTRITKNE